MKLDVSPGTPDGARVTVQAGAAAGHRVPAGAVLSPTPLIGTPDARILTIGDAVLGERVADDLAPVATVRHVGEDPGDAAVLDLAALEHVVRAGVEAGVDTTFPRAVRDLGARAVGAGHGDDGYSRVVDAVLGRA